MSIDTIGDFLTIIRNAIKVSHRTLVAPHSKVKERMAQILYDEGFIKDFTVIDKGDNKKEIKVSLKYDYKRGESAIHEITRISTPGRRIYQHADSLPHVIGKFGVLLVNTNRGMITDKQARELGVGGEIICSIW